MPPKKVSPIPTPTMIVRKKRPSTASAAFVASPQMTPPSTPVVVSPPKAPVQSKASAPPLAPLPAAVASQTAVEAPAQDPPQPNRTQREAQARWELLAVLRGRWPQVFPQDVQQIKPFALGIHREIAAQLPEIPPARIGNTLAFFQRWGKGAYWRAVLKGGPRYTLDGIPNGEVTDKDQEYARQQLAALKAWQQAKRQERQQTEALPHGGGKRTSMPQAYDSASGCTLRPHPS